MKTILSVVSCPNRIAKNTEQIDRTSLFQHCVAREEYYVSSNDLAEKIFGERYVKPILFKSVPGFNVVA